MGDKLIGSTVSVLTKKKLRYEGTLVNLDKAKKELHLENISQFGTEGRIGGTGEIQPRKDKIEFAVFSIDLIENFDVLQRPQKEDPAIITTKPVEKSVETSKEAVVKQETVAYGESR